eukprot:CAMPEP_0168590472 /NCGR_PEP_ID=MMETSP0420-20121227/6588_1 /TAXON_ID=498008 /ORGANISM="Pessonella sp." /LENGTH=467 /DNA_ID=CAMNT_0008626137 /DNA_START=19 /DNA_END=1419 /DNA_ORIENTATION=+
MTSYNEIGEPLLIDSADGQHNFRNDLEAPGVANTDTWWQRNRRALIFSISVVVIIGAACAVLIPTFAASNDLLSPDWRALQQRVQKRFSFLDDRLGGRVGPGCAVGVYNQGKIAFAQGFGHANLQFNQYIDPHKTVFRIASTSKQFTAACIAILIVDGKLSLNSTIGQFFPQLPQYANITVGELMYHTSGIPDYFNLFKANVNAPTCFDRDACVTLPTLLRVLKNSKAERPPGIEFQYDNSGYVMAGLIVESVTGLSLAEFAQRRIFTKLGMHNTRYQDNVRHLVASAAEGYSVRNHNGHCGARKCSPLDNYELLNTELNFVGDGGILTTVDDLLKWDENFYTSQLGGKNLTELQLRPGRYLNGSLIADDSFAGSKYALGLTVANAWSEQFPYAVVLHSGRFVGFTAQLLRFPQFHVSVCVLCNGGVETSAPNFAAEVGAMYFDQFQKNPQDASKFEQYAYNPDKPG